MKLHVHARRSVVSESNPVPMETTSFFEDVILYHSIPFADECCGACVDGLDEFLRFAGDDSNSLDLVDADSPGVCMTRLLDHNEADSLVRQDRCD